MFAVVLVGGDIHHAVVHKGLDAACQGGDGLEQFIEDDRLKGVQLQLTGLGCHGDGHIVADDGEGDLADHLGDNGVYFTGHDGRAVLLGRQVDLGKAGTGTGGHHTQVVGHFGQADRTGLEGAGSDHEAVQVLGGIHQIFCLAQVQTGNNRQVGNDGVDIALIGIDGSTDGGAAHIHMHQLIVDVTDAVEVSFHYGTVCAELLTQTDRDGILHLGTAHFQDMVELFLFFAQGADQSRQLEDHVLQQFDGGDLAGGGDHVVGGLRHIYMVIGMNDGVVAFFAAQNLDGTVGDHFVGVHVERGAGAALDTVGDKGIVQLAGQDLVTGLYDGVFDLFIHVTDLTVGDGTGFFYSSQRTDKFRMGAAAGDVKVFVGTDRLQSVVSFAFNFSFADEVGFDTHNFPPVNTRTLCFSTHAGKTPSFHLVRRISCTIYKLYANDAEIARGNESFP